ncbi:hypothetical protein [Haliangium sp.]|uniref:hypothetical protein n=1 Tax=Haliangium sp. TaxID=2663208 RepID=UPI003D0D685A
MSRSKPHSGRVSRHFSQQGIALIAVIVALVLAGVVVTEFSTNTTVDAQAAMNMEADMQAHFLARSAMNLSELVIQVQSQLVDKLNQQFKMDLQVAEYTGLFIGAFGGSKEEVEDVTAMLGGIRGGELKGLGVPGGGFDVSISTEDGKINLNCANKDAAGQEAQKLAIKLQSLFYGDAYDPIFQNEDGEGWRRDRNQQVEAIIDYIDRDQTRFDAEQGRSTGGAPEEYGYDNLRDKYDARNNYLDTVGEFKLIRGVDDRFWNLFGGNFTIYGDCQENLAAISDPKQIAAIIGLATKNPDDPVLRDQNRLWTLAMLVAKARELGFYFSNADDFATFVGDPMAAIEAVGIDPSLLPSYLPGLQLPIEGVELDKNKLGEIVKTGPRRTYRVEATASFGKLQKRIVGIWDTKLTRQNTRQIGAGTTTGGGTGGWVFWRED